MTNTEKELAKHYLSEDIENIEISAGRILLDSNHEVIKASREDIEKAKKAAKEFFITKTAEIKHLICVTYSDEIQKLNSQTDSSIELVGYISALLESNDISLGGLNYIFIAAWFVKNGINKICED